jgi:hypothetical protein
MLTILKSFLALCLLRLRPQDLPAAQALAAFAAFCYVAAGLVMGLQHMSPAGAVGLVVLDTGLLASLLWVLLWVRLMLNRFLQTFTALLGASAILDAVAVPLVIWQQQAIVGDGLTAMAVIASLLLWVWLLWTLTVIGHILRHAIGTILPVGVMLALLYMFISFSVTRSVFFPASGAAA